MCTAAPVRQPVGLINTMIHAPDSVAMALMNSAGASLSAPAQMSDAAASAPTAPAGTTDASGLPSALDRILAQQIAWGETRSSQDPAAQAWSRNVLGQIRYADPLAPDAADPASLGPVFSTAYAPTAYRTDDFNGSTDRMARQALQDQGYANPTPDQVVRLSQQIIGANGLTDTHAVPSGVLLNVPRYDPNEAVDPTASAVYAIGNTVDVQQRALRLATTVANDQRNQSNPIGGTTVTNAPIDLGTDQWDGYLQAQNLYTPINSALGEQYRYAMHEVADPGNSMASRFAWGILGTGVSIPGLLNDALTSLYNAPNNIYRSGQNAAIYASTGRTHYLSQALLDGSVGILGIAGAADGVPANSVLRQTPSQLVRRSPIAVGAGPFDAAASSAKFQGTYPYFGVDTLNNTSLPEGQQVVQITYKTNGEPIGSYFTTPEMLESVLSADGHYDANILNQSLQIYPGSYRNFKPYAQIYSVKEQIPKGGAANGSAVANPYFNPSQHAAKEQIFIDPRFYSNLEPVALKSFTDTTIPTYTPTEQIINNMLGTDTQ